MLDWLERTADPESTPPFKRPLNITITKLYICSMEKYRIHCERLSSSLDDCEKKLTGFEIQEDYHAADLRKVLTLYFDF